MIHGDQFRADLNGLGRDPDVIGWDGGALFPELGGDSGVPVRRDGGQIDGFNNRVGDKPVQLVHVLFITTAVAEPEHKFAQDYRRHENSLRPGEIGDEFLVTEFEPDIPVGIQEEFHFHIASSICSQISAEELTAVANRVQSDTFRSVETYLIVAVGYLALSLVMRAVFWLVGYFAFPRRRRLGTPL